MGNYLLYFSSLIYRNIIYNIDMQTRCETGEKKVFIEIEILMQYQKRGESSLCNA